MDLSYKVRLSALWLLAMVAFFAYRTLAGSEGATNVALLNNQDFATYLLVLMAFAFLSLTLPSRLNRLTNIIAGAIVGVLQVIMLVDGLLGYPSETFNLMTGVTVVAMASVVWFALRWPKRPDGTQPAPGVSSTEAAPKKRTTESRASAGIQ